MGEQRLTKACCIYLANGLLEDPGVEWNEYCSAWYLASEGQLGHFKISFCPWCGTKLEPRPVEAISLRVATYGEALAQKCRDCGAAPNEKCVSRQAGVDITVAGHHRSRWIRHPLDPETDENP